MKTEKRVIRLHRQESDYFRSFDAILNSIESLGYIISDIDSESNPVTYWIYTDCPLETLRHIDGVFDAI